MYLINIPHDGHPQPQIEGSYVVGKVQEVGSIAAVGSQAQEQSPWSVRESKLTKLGSGQYLGEFRS